MKKLTFLILVLLAGCSTPEKDYKTEYLQVIASAESIKTQQDQLERHLLTLCDSIVMLQDSIAALNERPLMSSEQFLLLYKYDRLNKYYRICKKNPVQWKYYKGWSIRVFEQ